MGPLFSTFNENADPFRRRRDVSKRFSTEQAFSADVLYLFFGENSIFFSSNQGSMLWFLRFLTVFCKNGVLFSKTNVVFKFLHDLALFCVTNANFIADFLQKYLKNHNIGPRLFNRLHTHKKCISIVAIFVVLHTYIHTYIRTYIHSTIFVLNNLLTVLEVGLMRFLVCPPR
jgi:hypothetical protein